MKSKYFKIKELVPLTLYNMLNEDLLWSMIDDNLISMIDLLKEDFPSGSIIINSYAWNGDRTQSGIRTKDSKYYSEGSQHSIGKAVDMIFSKYSTEDVRQHIVSSPDRYISIGGVELETSWLHIDVRDRKNGIIQVFKP